MDESSARRFLHKQRGAIFLRNVSVRLLGSEVRSKLFWATWPFATLECYSDCLLVKVAPLRATTIPLEDIDVIEFKRSTLFRLLTLRAAAILIRHRGEGSNPILFSAFSLTKAVRTLEGIGISVVPGSSRSPHWWPWW